LHPQNYFPLLVQIKILEDSIFSWLSQSTILVGAHFHSDRLQNLFDSHVSVPVAHGWDPVLLDNTGPRIDTVHIDFRNEANIWRDARVIVWATNA